MSFGGGNKMGMKHDTPATPLLIDLVKWGRVVATKLSPNLSKQIPGIVWEKNHEDTGNKV